MNDDRKFPIAPAAGSGEKDQSKFDIRSLMRRATTDDPIHNNVNQRTLTFIESLNVSNVVAKCVVPAGDGKFKYVIDDKQMTEDEVVEFVLRHTYGGERGAMPQFVAYRRKRLKANAELMRRSWYGSIQHPNVVHANRKGPESKSVSAKVKYFEYLHDEVINRVNPMEKSIDRVVGRTDALEQLVDRVIQKVNQVDATQKALQKELEG